MQAMLPRGFPSITTQSMVYTYGVRKHLSSNYFVVVNLQSVLTSTTQTSISHIIKTFNFYVALYNIKHASYSNHRFVNKMILPASRSQRFIYIKLIFNCILYYD